MREWLTAAEIAAERLPELPATESAVIRLARRHGWTDHPAHARPRARRGGGTEYNIALLPTVARVEYERRHRRVSMPEPAPDAPVPPASPTAPLTGRAARERDARLAVLAAFESFARGQKAGAALDLFVAAYNGRGIAIDGWIVDLVPRVSARTLARWRAARKAGEEARLAVDRGLARKGKGVLDTAEDGRVRVFILALLCEQPMFSARHIHDQIRSKFGDVLRVPKGVVPVPPVRTIRHYLKDLRESEALLLTKATHPDLYRSTMVPAGVGALRHVQKPNGLWMIDASPVDALCTDGRHSIYVCVDVATRRAVTYLSRTPRAEAVAMLLRKAILAFGVPDRIKTDNGSDFVARDTARLIAVLGIEAERSDAYAPQQKGHVERLIRTIQHDCIRLMPGFVGHSVADRKRIENRKSFAARLGAEDAETFGVTLSGADLAARIDAWIEVAYHHRPHAGLAGRSPFEAAASSEAAVRRVDERALDILLMPVAGKDGHRKVTKLGIRIGGWHYTCHEVHTGDHVFVRADPNDLGRVHVFAPDGERYLGPGVCPELAGVHPATMVKAKRESHAAFVAAKERELAEMKRALARGPAPIDRILEVARRDVPNVVALPKREEAHETPEIAAALVAAGVQPVEPPATDAGEPPAEGATVLAFRPAPGDRPRFRDDVDYAGWLLANPGELQPHDRVHLKDRLKSWTFRQLLAQAGLSADDVSSLISTPPREVSA